MERMIERTPPVLLTPAPSIAADSAHDDHAENQSIMADAPAESSTRPRLDPTRYGDWELNGKCVDF
jgi:hypothetical protein